MIGTPNRLMGLVNFLCENSGASAAEYAMILAIVGTALATAALFLGGAIADAMNTAATCISTQGATCT